MGEDLHKGRIKKKYYKERLEKIYCSTRKNILSEIAYPFKTYSSDVNSTSDYMRITLRTDLEPWLIVRKPIISTIFSPTLLQIYCIKLFGPISYSFWVWVTIGNLTISFIIYLAYKLQESMEYPNRNVLNKFLQTKTNQLFLKKTKEKRKPISWLVKLI